MNYAHLEVGPMAGNLIGISVYFSVEPTGPNFDPIFCRYTSNIHGSVSFHFISFIMFEQVSS